ncbi:M24 family metallopeptidase, partial [bacterium]|nr:M24 family metallopeptidase [bacterium]
MSKIPIKTTHEIEIMARAGKILAKILDELQKEVRVGIATEELEKRARELIKKYNVKPAFLGYEGYPAVLCVSVNDVIVHGLPSKYQIKDGDIVSLDFGIKYQGYFADMAVTIPVGNVTEEAKRLIRITK